MCTPYPQEKKGLTEICTSSFQRLESHQPKKPFFSLSRVIDHSKLSFSEANAHCFYAYIHAHVHNYVDQMNNYLKFSGQDDGIGLKLACNQACERSIV